MSIVLINGERARTAQQIADAVALAPESIRFKVDGDETLQPLVPFSQVSFATDEDVLGMIRIDAEGKGIVEVSPGPQVIETPQ